MLIELHDQSKPYFPTIHIKPDGPHLQQESIEKRYINTFATDEGDQFEIIAIHTLKPGYNDSEATLYVELLKISQAILRGVLYYKIIFGSKI